jgi:hypothetical protein
MPERAAALLLARLHDRQAVGPMGPQAQLPRSKGPAPVLATWLSDRGRHSLARVARQEVIVPAAPVRF